MIAMLENGHLNQEKSNSQLEKNQNQGANQAEEKQFVTIKEVVTLLNEDISMEVVAQKLGLRVNVLEAKLAKAAVVSGEDGQWIYIGENKKESLARNIYKKIYVKSYDQKYVQIYDTIETVANEPVTNLDYELYKESLKVKNPIHKKSVLFEEGLYDDLKEVSQKKSIKISQLINVLIKKGLDYYESK
ncbi:hypothetical protein NYE67_16635 [Solibacillus sp. FSL W8-0474]|uniref:hypothetical protein n=1 Tax=Solibacillus sp. FSL W8-0474 TaxID=2975336 RepID=UPI0030F697F5